MIAEVIESSTRHLVAEVYRDVDPPPFGSWVRVPHASGTELFGLVAHVEMASLEPNRRAVAWGKTPDELRRELPQVMELLRTTCRALIVAYRDAGGRLRQTLPPHPAALHAFVHACTDEDVSALGKPFDYLRTLVTHPDPSVPADDLLVALLTNLHRAHGGGAAADGELVEAGRVLSRLLRDDHERLQSILRRVG